MVTYSRHISFLIVSFYLWGCFCNVGVVPVAIASEPERGNLPFLAVVGFRTAETPAEAFLRSELFDEFNKSKRVRMVPEPLTNQIVEDVWAEDKSTSRQLIKDASANFNEGKKMYSQLSMEDAINSFNKAVVGYREGIGALRDNRYLLISHLYLGMALMVLGRKQEGQNFIREMIVLDANRNQRKLSQTEFPPEVIQTHRNVTKQVLGAPVGNLSITYKPSGAKVYVDAVLQGGKDKTTLDLPVGEHFVVVEKKGYRQFSKRVLIKPGNNPLNVELEEWQLLSPYSPEKRNSLLATEDLFKLASDLSTNMLVLGSISTMSNGRSEVVAQLFDIRTKEFSKIEKIEASESELQFSGRKLAKKLLESLSKTGSIVMESSPSQEAASSRIRAPLPKQSASPVIREKDSSKNSMAIHKQWWFWTALGVVVVGAGGYFLLGKKSDPSFNILEIDNPL